MAGWSPNIYVCVGDVELWVYIAKYGLIGLDNSFEGDIDEKIVRVDVLFDETFHLQECRKKVPFVLNMVRPVVATVSISQIMGNRHYVSKLRTCFHKAQDTTLMVASSQKYHIGYGCVAFVSLYIAGRTCLQIYKMMQLDTPRRSERNEPFTFAVSIGSVRDLPW